MRWGRKTPLSVNDPVRTAGAPGVLIAGGILGAVFFLVAVGSAHQMPDYPPEMAEAAVQAFVREHVALSDALGIDHYFPPDAVPVGSFEDKSEAGYREFVDRKWSFGDYLRDAFHTLIGETDP